MPIGDDTVVVTVDDHVSSELADEAIILQTDTGTYYGLNRVGKHLWELLDEPRRAGDLPGIIANEYDTTESDCRPDVFAFLQELLEDDLVEIRDDVDR